MVSLLFSLYWVIFVNHSLLLVSQTIINYRVPNGSEYWMLYSWNSHWRVHGRMDWRMHNWGIHWMRSSSRWHIHWYSNLLSQQS